MEFTLSEHAIVTTAERGIRPEWIERAIEQPQRVELAPDDSTKHHVFIAIPEEGDRVLRVIYNHTKNPPHVVTAYFDQSMKGKL